MTPALTARPSGWSPLTDEVKARQARVSTSGLPSPSMDMLEGDAFHAVRLDNTTGEWKRTGCTGPRGYREIGAYNSNPSANRWFERALA